MAVTSLTSFYRDVTSHETMFHFFDTFDFHDMKQEKRRLEKIMLILVYYMKLTFNVLIVLIFVIKHVCWIIGEVILVIISLIMQ